MNLKDIGLLRLHNQLITDHQFNKPEEVVAYMGAIQAQDFAGALWSIGLRTKNATIETVEKAIAARKIVRSWPMRGTLHFVAPENLRWMLDLLSPRIINRSAGTYKQLELDESVFSRSLKVVERAFAEETQLTRENVYRLLEGGGISCAGQRGIHIIGHLARMGYICHGSHVGKQATYVWLDSWVPYAAPIPKDEALGRLARSYFRSHGPATLNDFVWWTGLKVLEAREAISLIRNELVEKKIDDQVFWMIPELLEVKSKKKAFNLLPGFDEFMLGYTNRTYIVEAQYLPRIVPGKNGMFMPTIVVNGKVEGTWKRIITKNSLEVNFDPFQENTNIVEKTQKELNRYAAFLGKDTISTKSS